MGRHCMGGIAFACSQIETSVVGDTDKQVLAGKKGTSNQQCCQSKLTAPLHKGHHFEADRTYKGTRQQLERVKLLSWDTLVHALVPCSMPSLISFALS